jgi:hypothetical protein
VVDLGLRVDPSLHPRLGDIRAVVVRQVVAAQRDELRVVKPRVTEPPEIKMVDVSIDHDATLEHCSTQPTRIPCGDVADRPPICPSTIGSRPTQHCPANT